MGGGTTTLESLVPLSAADRARAIHQAGWTVLSQACIAAKGEGLRHPAVSAQRTAWAAGVRVSGSGDPARTYAGRLGGALTVDELLGKVKAGELTWAAACEHTPDGSAEPGTREDAGAAYAALMARDSAYVRNFAASVAKGKHIEAEDVAADAWHAFFCTYCRAGAPLRFLALCRVRSVLCTIVRRLAMNREQPGLSLDQETGDDGRSLGSALAVDGGPPVGQSLDRSELRRAVMEAIEALPARQALVTCLHLVEGLSQAQVAARLGCSRAYISQTLDKTLPRLREHLAQRGWSPREESTARS